MTITRTRTMTITLTLTLTLTAGEAAEAVKLRVAVGWCCAQVDVLGRTPLHLAISPLYLPYISPISPL